MWRYPDGTYRQNPPARVEYGGYMRDFADLDAARRDEIGYNEAMPLKREPYTDYETEWARGGDLIYREAAVSVTVDEAAKAEAEALEVRAERDRRLAESDWTQLADAPLDEAEKSGWAVFRQALRDVPQQGGFPGSVEWPESVTA
ncbi:tail fiber assembly protein [Pseudodesulfovibrio thermohalotolerans]|uniref:tail fiber assembly protein n=1 Tax=Pseudodesulfovibrio thermohalotolerans TaxID=2880651 RepID=UPI0022BA0B68|nr:tail fiber assembly protein [Pseudodesulfovibrio thermohalotolerans]WFS62484.1 tail fiber assembly protein [Pseudodesulfovibrio thermohalotolerans]